MSKLRLVLALLFMFGATGALAQLMLRNVGEGSGKTYVGPGNVIASPVACWSLRACATSTARTKIANICNAGDANCVDVFSTGDGDFETLVATSAPLSCGACTIKTWYDQTGNGNDVTQATEANRPVLTLNCLNTSFPCATYNGSKILTKATFSTTLAQPFMLSAVVNRTATSGQGTFLAFSATTGVQFLFAATANLAAMYGGNLVTSSAVTDNTWNALAGMYQATTSKMGKNGASVGINLGAPGTNSITAANPVIVGQNTGNPFNGKLAEAVVWGGDQSASFSALCHNQFVYWATSTSC